MLKNVINSIPVPILYTKYCLALALMKENHVQQAYCYTKYCSALTLLEENAKFCEQTGYYPQSRVPSAHRSFLYYENFFSSTVSANVATGLRIRENGNSDWMVVTRTNLWVYNIFEFWSYFKSWQGPIAEKTTLRWPHSCDFTDCVPCGVCFTVIIILTEM